VNGARHDVVGAVFEDHSGTKVVRARHSVVMSTGQRTTDDCPYVPATLMRPPSSTNLRIGLVSKFASRFGRLEILTDGNAQPSRSNVDAPVAMASRVAAAREES
jgi:hypothetical protein